MPNTSETPISAPVERTKVIFRWFDGDVIALFPELPASFQEPWLCDSFMHMGGHSAADCAMVIHRSRPATEAEYAPVKAELESAYDYHLTIRQRESSVMHHKRFAEAERLRNFKPTAPPVAIDNKPLSELQDPRYYFCQAEEEQATLCAYLGIPRASVTGALVIMNGDYEEVWITDSPAPYSFTAAYTRLL